MNRDSRKKFSYWLLFQKVVNMRQEHMCNCYAHLVDVGMFKVGVAKNFPVLHAQLWTTTPPYWNLKFVDPPWCRYIGVAWANVGHLFKKQEKQLFKTHNIVLLVSSTILYPSSICFAVTLVVTGEHIFQCMYSHCLQLQTYILRSINTN